LSLADDKNRPDIIGILENGRMPAYILFKEQLAVLDRENLHPEVYKHAKGSFQHKKYAHAILEVCKAYDKAVQDKTGLQKSGRALMQEAWAWKANTLRATTGTSELAEAAQPADHADPARSSHPIGPAVPRPLHINPINCQAYTFSGTAINRTLSLILKHFNVSNVQIEQESAFFISHPKEVFLSSWAKIKAAVSTADFDPDQLIRNQLAESPLLLSFSKWAEYLPLPFQVAVLKKRHFDFPGAVQFIQTVSWQETYNDQSLELNKTNS
jgi:hypothetical protein